MRQGQSAAAPRSTNAAMVVGDQAIRRAFLEEVLRSTERYRKRAVRPTPWRTFWPRGVRKS